MDPAGGTGGSKSQKINMLPTSTAMGGFSRPGQSQVLGCAPLQTSGRQVVVVPGFSWTPIRKYPYKRVTLSFM